MSQQDTNAFTEVSVFTGQSLGASQRQVESGTGLAATDQQRAIAEVQAALVIAQSRPRNEVQSRDRLLRACQRSGLASVAVYKYPRGGQSVSGPSIRLAEAAARAWGNMTYGFREVARQPGSSECEAFAWDLETNTKAVRQFSVRHWRDTRQGGHQLKDERDIYEIMASHAQRRVRAAILEIIPGDIIEDALIQCESTLKSSIGDTKAAVAGMLNAFAKYGVSKSAIEKRLGHRVDAIQPAQIMDLRKIYASINDGFSEAKEWFEVECAVDPAPPVPPDTAPVPESATEEKPAAPAKTSARAEMESLREDTRKLWESTGRTLEEAQQSTGLYMRQWNRAACTKLQETARRILSEQEAPPVKHPAQQVAQTQPAESASTIFCPSVEGNIDELQCASCQSRDGCPAWE